ncbi:Holliday junction branch migration protein RuvA [Macrococcus hajekii]|uniref:Holliday junction branch migration complex subunit RuvA n=1 Tax=Macrococcus hajekii TaxID=198482 RepID=A0A4V3BEB2_9STAP|nr:Holliday junction branch migration protein RuvA [Macrococcus hajekii]TDM02815.1 Holliday junction branch migration protein RuvA [Macrococcus hajekii]GGB04124.1 Holliday junction ATP-dependent DNA helicase RuvA [Macrococcus hajekii]
MYAYLQGQLTQITPTHVVMDIGGIGYECHTPNPYRLQKYLNKETKLFTQLIVREDAHTLYGFPHAEEKSLFLSLNKVTGIGPKSALAILATSTPDEIRRAIEDENESYLMKFPGIGKKTARQIILDLKGKLVMTDESALFEEFTDTVAVAEALLALEALGYSKRELTKVEKVLKAEKIEQIDDNIKRGLQILVS